MLIQELSNAIGVSGEEDEVRGVILRAISEYVEDIRIDPMGNVLAVKRGNAPKVDDPRVMLAAHMDEVGFMVSGIEADGTLRLDPVGGFDDRILPGARLVVGKNKVPGVFDWRPIHSNRSRQVVKIDKLRLDIGASSKEQANGKVKIGDRATFDTICEERNRVLTGKAFDDRVGCAVLIELIQGEGFPFDVHVAFTVQEEIGLRGALVAAQTIEPDVAFILETTTAHDLPPVDKDPETPSVTPVAELDHGPVITLLDRSVIVDSRLLNHLRDTADALNIPYQYKRGTGGGTDAGSVFVSNKGVPSAVISVPARYIHGPKALCKMDDVENTVRLVREALARFSRSVLERKR